MATKKSRSRGLSGAAGLGAPTMVCNKVTESTRKVCKGLDARSIQTYMRTSGPIAGRCSAAGGTLGTKRVRLCDGRSLGQGYVVHPFKAGQRTVSKQIGKRSVGRGAQFAVYNLKASKPGRIAALSAAAKARKRVKGKGGRMVFAKG